MGAGGDHQCGVGVPQVVEPHGAESASADGGSEDAVAEVVVVEDLAPGEGNTSPNGVGRRAPSWARRALVAASARSTRRRAARVLTGTSWPA